MKIFSEIKFRLKAPTPKFFKKVQRLGVVLTSICTPVVAIPTTYTGVVIPDILIKICSYMIVAGVVMVSISSLTKDDSIKSENS